MTLRPDLFNPRGRKSKVQHYVEQLEAEVSYWRDKAYAAGVNPLSELAAKLLKEKSDG